MSQVHKNELKTSSKTLSIAALKSNQAEQLRKGREETPRSFLPLCSRVLDYAERKHEQRVQEVMRIFEKFTIKVMEQIKVMSKDLSKMFMIVLVESEQLQGKGWRSVQDQILDSGTTTDVTELAGGDKKGDVSRVVDFGVEERTAAGSVQATNLNN